MDALKPFEAIIDPVTAAWVISLFIVLFALWYCRGAVGGLLLKLYDFFILRSPFQL